MAIHWFAAHEIQSSGSTAICSEVTFPQTCPTLENNGNGGSCWAGFLLDKRVILRTAKGRGCPPANGWGLSWPLYPVLRKPHVTCRDLEEIEPSQLRRGGLFGRGSIWRISIKFLLSNCNKGKTQITPLRTQDFIINISQEARIPMSLWHCALKLCSKMSYNLGVWKNLVLICKWMRYYEKQPNTKSKASAHLPLPNGTRWGHRGRKIMQWYFTYLLPKARGFSFSFILNHPLQTHRIVQIAKALKF